MAVLKNLNKLSLDDVLVENEVAFAAELLGSIRANAGRFLGIAGGVAAGEVVMLLASQCCTCQYVTRYPVDASGKMPFRSFRMDIYE